jgi:hypothetical protein
MGDNPFQHSFAYSLHRRLLFGSMIQVGMIRMTWLDQVEEGAAELLELIVMESLYFPLRSIIRTGQGTSRLDTSMSKESFPVAENQARPFEERMEAAPTEEMVGL